MTPVVVSLHPTGFLVEAGYKWYIKFTKTSGVVDIDGALYYCVSSEREGPWYIVSGNHEHSVMAGPFPTVMNVHLMLKLLGARLQP